MGTGWRKAFCSTIQKNRDFNTDMVKLPEEQEDQQKLKFLQKFGFLSSGSTSTPRFHSNGPKLSCKTSNSTIVQQPTSIVSSKLHCNTSTLSTANTTTPKSCIKDSRKLYGSNPSSPRSPLSILKTTLRRSKSSCGVCTQSARTNQKIAIFTGECSHTFHFPCIAEYTKKHTTLICPVCQSTWKDVPLLTNHKLHYQNTLIHPHEKQEQEIPINQKTPSPRNVNQETLLITKNGDSEAYNDDETLVSPEFVPILSENENPEEADDVQEFQGFFVNSIPSDESSCYSLKESRNIEVSLLPESAVVAVGQTHETIALVLKVKAPSAHSSHPAQFHETSAGRAPVDLVSVLDLSGSMSGPKLQMLKRAMKLVISSLGSADRLSIVSFSATPKRLLPLTRMNPHGQHTARRIVDRLGCSQGTSVCEALKIATKILQDRRERNPVATVILLSDDPDDMLQTNGDDDRRGYHESTTRFSHVEIPVPSSGFGRKFGFMTNEPHEDAFSKCVGGLLSVVLHDLQIQITAGSGSDPAEIGAVYSCNVQPALLGLGSIRVGDLYAEEEREFLIELKVPVLCSKSHHVLSVKCSFKHPTTKEQSTNLENNLLVPRPQEAGQSSFPRSEWLRNLFVFTRALAESRRLIELNELTITAHLLTSALELVMHSKCGSANEFIKGLELKLGEVHWRQQMILQQRKHNASLLLDKYGEPLTPISARRAAVKLAKPVLRRSMSQITDLHGFENARF